MDDRTLYRSYNRSIFDLRYNYQNLFGDVEAKLEKDKIGGGCYGFMQSVKKFFKGGGEKRKLHKITYTVNMLPNMGEHISIDKDGNSEVHNVGKSVMQMCIDSG